MGLLLGCTRSCDQSAPTEGVGATSKGESAPAKEHANRIVLLGDSLTAGYGLEQDQSYPSLVQGLIDAKGLDWKVINAGVSGDTSKGGLERIPWILKSKPHAVFVALGANDGLRGVDPSSTQKNLQGIVEKLVENKVQVFLAGMRLPLNYGPGRGAEFEAVYKTLAEQFQLPLMPFLLKDVALEPSLNLPDGIHPNPKGAKVIAEHVFEFLEPYLKISKEGE